MNKTESQAKLNIATDELNKNFEMVKKQNNLLMWLYQDLKLQYNSLVEENKNLKWDFGKLYDLIQPLIPKKENIKKLISPIKKINK